MHQNPLQQYFRQPKIFVKLPSKGIFNVPGSMQGDLNNMPVYGMTGMDEILMKTPDALMSGTSVVNVIQSCCPNIVDAWELRTIDVNMVLAAMRIATYGNDIKVTHKCTSCGEINDFSLDLSKLIEHYNAFVFKNRVDFTDFSVTLQPLTYREATEFSIKNFALRRQLLQAANIEDEGQRTKTYETISKQLSDMQVNLVKSSIESVVTPGKVVTEQAFIQEWIQNCDRAIFDAVKQHIEQIRTDLTPPPFTANCDDCGADNQLSFELDESNFFVNA